jgi:hypothetical protein
MGTLLEDQYTFFTKYLSVLVRKRNILYQHCVENQNTHSMFNNIFPPENPAIYEIMWKNLVGSQTDHRWQYNKTHALYMLEN